MEKKSKNISWYKIVNNKIKIENEDANYLGIITDKCTICKFPIVTTSYQQKECGCRYCKDCYELIDAKYYCDACKIEEPENFVHNKSDIFIDKALTKDLERIIIKCPDCNEEFKVSELESHVLACPDGWKYCDDCKTMVKKTHICEGLDSLLGKIHQAKYKLCHSCGKECIDIADHVSKCTINWKTNCPYGCIESSNIETHRKDKSFFHLDKAWAIMQEHKLTDAKTENPNKYESMLKPIVENVRKSLGIDGGRIGNLVDELKSLNETVKEEISIYESIKISLKSQISDSLYTSFDGTILWRIDNFENVKQKAISGEQKSIFSPPFYTSRFGYKMCLRLYPNGDTTAFNVAMSLFLVLMKGNYDSLLNWPFKQKVTFILLDQDFKTNMIDAFVPSENLTSFSRPRTDMNIPSGSSYFIKFEDMHQRKYIKEGTAFIRCIIDCSDLHE